MAVAPVSLETGREVGEAEVSGELNAIYLLLISLSDTYLRVKYWADSK